MPLPEPLPRPKGSFVACIGPDAPRTADPAFPIAPRELEWLKRLRAETRPPGEQERQVLDPQVFLVWKTVAIFWLLDCRNADVEMRGEVSSWRV